MSGRVVGIADGDTITILTDLKQQVKVRISGIDAPEKGQAFDRASKENLSSLVFGQVVTIESNKRDRYGRVVGKVLVQGRDVGLNQLFVPVMHGITKSTSGNNRWQTGEPMQRLKPKRGKRGAGYGRTPYRFPVSSTNMLNTRSP